MVAAFQASFYTSDKPWNQRFPTEAEFKPNDPSSFQQLKVSCWSSTPSSRPSSMMLRLGSSSVSPRTLPQGLGFWRLGPSLRGKSFTISDIASYCRGGITRPLQAQQSNSNGHSCRQLQMLLCSSGTLWPEARNCRSWRASCWYLLLSGLRDCSRLASGRRVCALPRLPPV